MMSLGEKCVTTMTQYETRAAWQADNTIHAVLHTGLHKATLKRQHMFNQQLCFKPGAGPCMKVSSLMASHNCMQHTLQ
jgi:hypothetical protein